MHQEYRFTLDTTTGYTQTELDALNTEFNARWNGWDIEENKMFLYSNGTHMSAEDAWKAFSDEVAGR
jgi:hypothetical protein